MQTLIDFLNFKLLISPYVLVIGYYIGALVVPIGSWLLVVWIRRKYALVSDIYESSKKTIKAVTHTFKDRMLFYGLFMVFFISIEIIWRMMFEFMMAYFQMRDMLMMISAQ